MGICYGVIINNLKFKKKLWNKQKIKIKIINIKCWLLTELIHNICLGISNIYENYSLPFLDYIF